jgi:hypothetical protein
LKKVIAIFLVILILFNTLGFYGIFVGLRYKAKKDIVHRLDNDQYQYKETITLKVPLSIPYNTDDEDYERVDGEVEYQGEFYRLVKQKLVSDTLYIVCIKDIKSKQIKQALADYVKSFTDKPADNKSQGKMQTTFIKDFLPTSFSLSASTEGWNSSLILNRSDLSAFSNRPVTFIGPPPKS